MLVGGRRPPASYPAGLAQWLTFVRAELGARVRYAHRRIALQHVCGSYFLPNSGSIDDIGGGRETVTVFICLRRVNARSQGEGAVPRLGVEQEVDVP